MGVPDFSRHQSFDAAIRSGPGRASPVRRVGRPCRIRYRDSFGAKDIGAIIARGRLERAAHNRRITSALVPYRFRIIFERAAYHCRLSGEQSLVRHLPSMALQSHALKTRDNVEM